MTRVGHFSILSCFLASEQMNIRVKLNRLIKPFFGSGLDFFMPEKVDLSTIAKKTRTAER